MPAGVAAGLAFGLARFAGGFSLGASLLASFLLMFVPLVSRRFRLRARARVFAPRSRAAARRSPLRPRSWLGLRPRLSLLRAGASALRTAWRRGLAFLPGALRLRSFLLRGGPLRFTGLPFQRSVGCAARCGRPLGLRFTGLFREQLADRAPGRSGLRDRRVAGRGARVGLQAHEQRGRDRSPVHDAHRDHSPASHASILSFGAYTGSRVCGPGATIAAPGRAGRGAFARL